MVMLLRIKPCLRNEKYAFTVNLSKQPKQLWFYLNGKQVSGSIPECVHLTVMINNIPVFNGWTGLGGMPVYTTRVEKFVQTGRNLVEVLAGPRNETWELTILLSEQAPRHVKEWYERMSILAPRIIEEAQGKIPRKQILFNV